MVIAAILVISLMTAATVWELYFAGNRSIVESATSIIGWTGPSTATTAIIITILEASGSMIMKQRYLDMGRKIGVKEGARMANEAWNAWLKRKEEAESCGGVFTEPPPVFDGGEDLESGP